MYIHIIADMRIQNLERLLNDSNTEIKMLNEKFGNLNIAGELQKGI